MDNKILGMIETDGLVAALFALSKMEEVGKIEFYKKEVLPNGQITVFVFSNAEDFDVILEAGVIAANNVGKVIAAGKLPFPNSSLQKLLDDEKSTQKRKVSAKNKKKEEDGVVTLFDQLDNSEDRKNEKSRNTLVRTSQLSEEVNTEIASLSKNKDAEKLNKKYDSFSSVEQELNIEVQESKNILLDIKDTDSDENTGSVNGNIIAEIEESGINDGKTDFDVKQNALSHLEKLRAEAKAEIDSSVNSDSTNSFSDEALEELATLNVHELRKRARATENFPIKGRDISKANRKVLLEYFANI